MVNAVATDLAARTRTTIDDIAYRIGALRQRRQLKSQIQTVSIAPRDVVLFAVVNNEQLRLPYFLEYYRTLGIRHLFFLDHQSTDGTRDVLRRAGAVTYSVSGDFVYKDVWLDTVLRAHGQGRWCLILDADELFVFPGAEYATLASFCDYVDREGARAVRCRLIDMFPPAGLASSRYEAGQPLLDAAPMFDPDLVTRERAFGVAPCLEKRPLIRFDGRTMRLSPGQHFVSGAQDSAVTGGLLHFKFLGDFLGQRTLDRAEAARQSAHRDPWYANETEAYATLVSRDRDLGLMTPTAVRYTGPQQLVDLDIMTAPASYRRWLGTGSGVPVAANEIGD